VNSTNAGNAAQKKKKMKPKSNVGNVTTTIEAGVRTPLQDMVRPLALVVVVS